MDIKYYDIGLNLFTRSFPKPEKVITDAAADGICCILTGSEARENRLVNQFVRNHTAFGTAGIHPHVADEATEADLEEIRRIVTTNPKVVDVFVDILGGHAYAAVGDGEGAFLLVDGDGDVEVAELAFIFAERRERAQFL